MGRTFIPERGPDGRILVEAPAVSLTEMLPAMPDAQAPREAARPALTRRELALWSIPALLLCLVAASVLARWGAPVTATPAPAPTAAAVQATPAPTLAPTAAALLDRAIVAYAAPDGDILGAVEAGRPYTPTGRYGSTWAQLDVGERAPIWVRLGDMPGLTVAGLPDLAPKPTPIPVPAVVPVVPAAVPAADCTETSATFRASQRVEVNGVLRGEAAAWSCVSQAAADQELARRVADLAR